VWLRIELLAEVLDLPVSIGEPSPQIVDLFRQTLDESIEVADGDAGGVTDRLIGCGASSWRFAATIPWPGTRALREVRERRSVDVPGDWGTILLHGVLPTASKE